ncbi:MAG: hypothetical protein ACRDH9_06825 [Actinomycetota bacterium]
MIRFLVGSTLLFIGVNVIASAAITVVGLPIGLAVFGAGLQLMVGRRDRPTPAGGKEV